MQWIPSDEHKRRDEAFADFIGGVAYEEDRGWTKEVWDTAWSARRDEAVAEKQEPVAMRYDFDGYGYKYIDNGSGSDWQTRIKDAEPVFAHPQPKREWQGLTDEDIKEIIGYHGDLNANGYTRQLFAKIEAKLREKNCG